MKKRYIIIICLLPIMSWFHPLFFSHKTKVPIGRFYKVDDVLYRGAQPIREDDFQFLKEIGIKTVISLRNKKKIIKWENNLCAKYKLNFVNIPLNAKEGIPERKALQFLSIISNTKYRPIFLHCQHGRDRTGCMVALYRVVYYGWTPLQAYKEALKFGFHRFYKKYKKFILEETIRYRNKIPQNKD